MLHIINCNKVKNTIYDLKVRIMAEGIATYSNRGYDGFKNEFAVQIRNIQSLNAYSPEQSYVIVDRGFYLQVWHKNTSGDRDRLVLEVFDIADQTPNF